VNRLSPEWGECCSGFRERLEHAAFAWSAHGRDFKLSIPQLNESEYRQMIVFVEPVVTHAPFRLRQSVETDVDRPWALIMLHRQSWASSREQNACT
jgi:hypothetical protein